MEGRAKGEQGLYVTLSETTEELQAGAESHGWSLDRITVYELAVGATVTLVALTGYGQVEDRHRAAEAGFDLHLTKPVDFGALWSLLASPAPTRRPP